VEPRSRLGGVATVTNSRRQPDARWVRHPLALPPMWGWACRRLAPPAKGGGVGNSAAWCKELLSNRSGRGRSTCS